MAQDDRLRRNRSAIDSAYDEANKVGRRQKNTAKPGTITGRASQVADYRANNARTPPMNQVTEASVAPGALRSGARQAQRSAMGALTQSGATGSYGPSGATGSFTNEAPPRYGSPSRKDTPAQEGRGPTTSEMIQRTIGQPDTQRETYFDSLRDTVGGAISRGGGALSTLGAPTISGPGVPTRMTPTRASRRETGRRDNTPTPPVPQVNATALDMAMGVGSGQGYVIGPDGRTQFVPGTQRTNSNLSVVGNMEAAGEEFARANEIRQGYIDSQRPQNQVTVVPNSGIGGGGAGSQIERLISRAGRTNDLTERAAINRQISQLQGEADRTATSQSALDVQQLRNQGSLATARAQQEGGQSVNPYDQARALQTIQEMERGERAEYPTYDPDEIEAIMSMPNEEMQQVALQQYAQRQDRQFAEARLDSLLGGASRQDALESFQAGDLAPDSELGQLIQQLYGTEETEDFSMGGIVPEFSAIGFAQGGMVPDQYGAEMGPGMDMGSAMGMGAPGQGGIDLMQMEYDQYAQGAQSIGVPAIPFEEFVGLKQQSIPQAPQAPGQGRPMTSAMQSAIKMAEGGSVPGADRSDASGKMIVDSDPDAPQDSIPAVIDGNRPAKLDSGEFVFPKDVVLFFGTDKLNKMIEQAKEKGQGNGTQPGSASAVQQSASAAG